MTIKSLFWLHHKPQLIMQQRGLFFTLFCIWHPCIWNGFTFLLQNIRNNTHNEKAYILRPHCDFHDLSFECKNVGYVLHQVLFCKLSNKERTSHIVWLKIQIGLAIYLMFILLPVPFSFVHHHISLFFIICLYLNSFLLSCYIWSTLSVRIFSPIISFGCNCTCCGGLDTIGKTENERAWLYILPRKRKDMYTHFCLHW